MIQTLASCLQIETYRIEKTANKDVSFFPKQVYLWGSYLRKIETGHAGGHAVLGWARDLALLGALGWVGRGVWLWWARWAGLGVGFGSGVGVWLWCAGLGWARIWLSVYGLHCTCLFHIFMMSLCLFSCESQMCIMGLEQSKACHW